MTGSSIKPCGLCAVRTKYIGSHVLHSHVPKGAGPDEVMEVLRAERRARLGRRPT